MRRILTTLLLGAGLMLAVLLGGLATAAPALAGPATVTTTTVGPSTVTAAVPGPAPVTALPARPVSFLALPAAPVPPADPDDISINVGGGNGKPSSSIVILLGMTVLSVAPALLLLCTSFTKIFVVLGITRNALGLATTPPNQVLAGLALFLSLFIMGPVLSDMNSQGVQPYLKGEKTQSQAFNDGVEPLREFMLQHTRKDEIALLTKAANDPQPATPDDVPLTTLVPAFVLSELRAAFIIGFVIFVPFLVIDMVVAASLMSLGMMMLPPVTVSLPFKLLLFVLVNGWGLIITALVASY
ncbi:flagellar biosynthetic protein FliP [Micromonospora pattaloongensis]|uniref:Flagellar biosynthetic protein FliP n=1 Tax=Micromonospora pattaloongensis TaxID=405436 RepID=A0A1H3MY04_9ACTN|nr:flagellar type III secretion system pore protein FliP [Micromonospora pattaloongensis]SDY81571.1 flagellar biosynthetic protein FliP [Micromonospora pattaloongensis]